jgi:hypothetical protein
MRTTLVLTALAVLAGATRADELPVVKKVERQPLAAQAARLTEALHLAGAPLSDADKKTLADAKSDKDEAKAVAAIQAVLDKRCLAGVTLRADKTSEKSKSVLVEAKRGPAAAELAEEGWRVFLVKVFNEAGSEGRLLVSSPNAAPLTRRSSGGPAPKVEPLGQVGKRFLDLVTLDQQPLAPTLSGLEVEYRIVSIYCRDSGRKEATLRFRVGPDDKKAKAAEGEELPVVFESTPAVLVKLRVKDHDGKSSRDGRPVMAAFTIRDEQGRVHPSPARRLAPDLNFHFQIYRADGETVALQAGTYTVSWTRGPEYLVQTRKIKVPAGKTHTESFALKRWVHCADKGWWSGDHHIHAAGCAHYESPTEGVTPEDMMRHVLGEDLNVGCCLSWGPCWYHQKRYFEGKVHPLSTASHLLRYDVEVSGFPSSHTGHVCLLRLKQQDYPGTKLIEDWPSWALPIMRWAKKQGAVVGPAHSGWGLAPMEKKDEATTELPNYLVPRMDSIGANEYLVHVALDACDFMSTVDTPAIYELNIWYHTLNCGFRARVSGETDFPCIYGERVGLGRSYVHLDGKLDFNQWVEGIKNGRCYVSDGKSHLMDFTVDGLGVGLKNSELKLDKAGKVKVKANVAALLEPKPTEATERIRKAKWNARPYWDLERVRVKDTRTVPVEVIVNGQVVDKVLIDADGSTKEVSFDVPIKHSSWVALRVLGSSHTNPVFVLVDGKPIRASKKSAEWCLKGVDQCWKMKVKAIREKERADAEKAYDEARTIYRGIAKESIED